MEEWPYRLLACIGFVTITFLAWVTGKRSRLNWTTIGGSATLAWGLGIVSFWFPGSRWLWSMVNDLVVTVLTAVLPVVLARRAQQAAAQTRTAR